LFFVIVSLDLKMINIIENDSICRIDDISVERYYIRHKHDSYLYTIKEVPNGFATLAKVITSKLRVLIDGRISFRDILEIIIYIYI